MARTIKLFGDGSLLEYDQGNFDEWCIFLTRTGHTRFAPKDWQYFTRLQELATAYGKGKVYADFEQIFNTTSRTLDSQLLDRISSMSIDYTQHTLRADMVFTLLYAGMLAEENKAYAPLGKRIKHLGVYQVVIEGMWPREAATFSVGRPWQELAHLCEERGF